MPSRPRIRTYTKEQIKLIEDSLDLARSVVTYLKIVRAPLGLQLAARRLVQRMTDYRNRAWKRWTGSDHPNTRVERRRSNPRMYVVNQHFPSLVWRAVPIERAQGEAMRRRGEPVYDTRVQAETAVMRARIKVKKGRKPVDEKVTDPRHSLIMAKIGQRIMVTKARS